MTTAISTLTATPSRLHANGERDDLIDAINALWDTYPTAHSERMLAAQAPAAAALIARLRIVEAALAPPPRGDV